MKDNAGIIAIPVILALVLGAAVLGGILYYAYPMAFPTPSSTVGISASTSTPVTATGTAVFWISPTSGPVGTVVTLHGADLAATNTVELGNMVAASLRNIPSTDGATLTFTIPESIGPNCAPGEMCAQYLISVTPNTYEVSVESDGVIQPAGSFRVTTSP